MADLTQPTCISGVGVITALDRRKACSIVILDAFDMGAWTRAISSALDLLCRMVMLSACRRRSHWELSF